MNRLSVVSRRREVEPVDNRVQQSELKNGRRSLQGGRGCCPRAEREERDARDADRGRYPHLGGYDNFIT